MSDARHGRRVGEVAAAAGVTIRTLHHYESVGLLTPPGRTDAGYRIYDDESVQRIYRICVLRRLGMSLTQIARALGGDEWNLTLDDVEQRLSAASRLRAGLAQLLSQTSTEPDPTQSLMEVLTEMTTLDHTVEEHIQIIVYADMEAAMAFLIEAFDLGPGEITRDGDGAPVHGTVHAGTTEIWLHPESPEFGLSSPRILGAATATTAVMVDDVDAHHKRAKAKGAEIVYAPVDQPYGYREYSARDPEGGLWSFMKTLPNEQPA